MEGFLEKTLEDIIFQNKEKIQEKGFCSFYKNTVRRFPLNCKFIDIFSWEIDGDELRFKIIELKKDNISVSSLLQISGYYCDLMHAISGHFKSVNSELVLVGSNYDNDMLGVSMLTNSIRYFIYSYGIDGIKFKEDVYTEMKEYVEDPSNYDPKNSPFIDRLLKQSQ